MTPVEPVELSALIDGELSAGRAAEVRAALNGDAELQRRYQALRNIDERLHATAAATLLEAQVRLPPGDSAARRAGSSPGWPLLAAAAILLAWVIGKLTATALPAVASSACALAVLLAALVAFVTTREDVQLRTMDHGVIRAHQ